MFRRTVLTATAALAVIAATAPAGQADFDFGTTQPASVSEMQTSVVTQMQGKAFGWQLAIAQGGQLKVTDKRGTAVSQADNNGTSIAMQPTMKMELASVTKNITAVATMKLLRRNSLTVESLVWPYLPSGWDVSEFKSVRFRHLLSHTSGLNQAITAMPDATRPTNNGWNAMRTVVENGTVVDSQRQYKNANFAILRIVNAELWNRSGGKKFVTWEEEFENSHGAIETKEYTEEVPITASNHTSYVLEYMRKHIFEPAGLYGVGCIPNGTTSGVRSYPVNATQSSNGSVLGTSSEECAGARGIALSSVQLVQYLAHLRHGTMLDPADRATMDKLRAGWNEDSNGGDGGQYGGPADGVADNWRSPGAFWHGGALLGTNELHTCAMTFTDGTEAALLVNSEMDEGSGSPCGVLLKAWYDAKP